ncbi:Alpha/Beta hydrolase protein [Collybia nuda]|uniref:Alpha/Beta hydrolase protein n=1 Tax=Collybia nuda TaxID=64659 RepID=A0A9P5Y107_9AGAR|nr:Alpha/Beta hydrolase protein [Collybia nuda]
MLGSHPFLINTVTSGAVVAEAPALTPRTASAESCAKDRDASSAYSNECLYPNGKRLIKMFSNTTSGTQGFIAADDKRKEIIVAFRGSESIRDAYTDIQTNLVQFQTGTYVGPPTYIQSLTIIGGVLVHEGFLGAWNSVAFQIVEAIRPFPRDYIIVTTGHSLGGAIASLAGISLKVEFARPLENFVVPLRIYTYGQPRTGSIEYARWINNVVGTSVMFRSVNANDW